MSEWKKVKFLDVISLNPRISLEKGVEYPFVEMSNAVPGARRPEKDVYQKYSGGGAKFEEGDTVVARIEPCLQNGKGFQCPYKKGFGSTEFLVFRPMNIKEMDYNFLYYYMGQQSIREAMAKTMVGASGRQRVNNAVFNDLQIHLPPLSIQQDIADILSAYDDLIEVNRKQIKLLEEAAQRLYKEWFVDLHFPGHENTKIVNGMPEGWDIKSIIDVFDFKYGKILPTKDFVADGPIPVYGASKQIGRYTKANCFEPKVLVGSRGNAGYVHRTIENETYVTNNSFIVNPFDNYKHLKLPFIYESFKVMDFVAICTGAAQPQLTLNSIASLKYVVPKQELIIKFCDVTANYFETISIAYQKIRLLTEARDRLLPKLMSGEIKA